MAERITIDGAKRIDFSVYGALASEICDVSRAFFDLFAEEKNAVGESGSVLGGLPPVGPGRATRRQSIAFFNDLR